MRDRPKIQIPIPPTTRIPIAAPIDTGHGPFLRVFSLGVRDVLEGLIVSRYAISFLTHYVRPDTIPCYRPFGIDCELCGKVSQRWSGYLGMFSFRHRRYGMAPLTNGAVRTCPRLADVDGDLRGHRVKLIRGGTHKRGPLTAIVSDHAEQTVNEEQELTSEQLVRAICNLWGVEFCPQINGTDGSQSS